MKTHYGSKFISAISQNFFKFSTHILCFKAYTNLMYCLGKLTINFIVFVWGRGKYNN